MAVLVGSVVLYGAGWVLGWTPLVVIAVAGLLAVVTAVAWILRRPDLVLDRRLSSDRVARGQPAESRLNLRNRARWPSPRLVAVDEVGGQPVPVAVPRIAARHDATVIVPVPTDRRGIHTVGPLRVEHADPFGLMRRDQPLGAVAMLWVHPRVHSLMMLPTRRSPSLEGPMADTVPTGSITFHALREYVRGDDLRHIHWRSTAKTGTLMVREHVDTSRPDTTVLLETDAGAYTGERFEEAVDVAASVLSSVALAGFPARLVTTGELSLGDGAQIIAPSAFLDDLAGLRAGGSLTLTTALQRLRRDRGSGTLVVVTGTCDDDRRAQVAALRPRFDRVVLVSLTDGPAGMLPRSPGVVEVDVPDGDALAAAWPGIAAT